MTTHEEQQRIWDAEHASPHVLLQMDKDTPSSTVVDFWQYLIKNDLPRSKGIEMGCGKGRNSIWLAGQGVEMTGFDFSPTAIHEAKRRADAGKTNLTLIVQDATTTWGQESDTFDFAIDCFASTDIESSEGRARALKEFHRVLKPGGLLLTVLLSTDDAFHKKMLLDSPGPDRNSFVHTTGKYEKVFDEDELATAYAEWKLLEARRVKKTSRFFGEPHDCLHFWRVYQKYV